MNISRNRAEYIPLEKRAQLYADRLRAGRDIESLTHEQKPTSTFLGWLIFALACLLAAAIAFLATAHFFGSN